MSATGRTETFRAKPTEPIGRPPTTAPLLPFRSEESCHSTFDLSGAVRRSLEAEMTDFLGAVPQVMSQTLGGPVGEATGTRRPPDSHSRNGHHQSPG